MFSENKTFFHDNEEMLPVIDACVVTHPTLNENTKFDVDIPAGWRFIPHCTVPMLHCNALEWLDMQKKPDFNCN